MEAREVREAMNTLLHCNIRPQQRQRASKSLPPTIIVASEYSSSQYGHDERRTPTPTPTTITTQCNWWTITQPRYCHCCDTTIDVPGEFQNVNVGPPTLELLIVGTAR